MSTELSALKSYEAMLPTRSGAITRQSKYKYLGGEPFVYKYNAGTGQFVDADNEPIMSNGQRLKELVFQPIAFRFFRDNLFGRKEKDDHGNDTLTPKFEDWGEIFFIDESNRACVIMLSGTTLSSLKKSMKGLFYDPQGRMMNEIVLTMKPEMITAKNDSSKKWYQGNFKYTYADPNLVKEFADFDRDFPLYQSSTITPSCQLQSYVGAFFEKMDRGEVSVSQEEYEETEEGYTEQAPTQGWSQPQTQPRQAPAASGNFNTDSDLPF